MKACDDCAWPMSCHVSGQCARAPFTAAQEARLRELIAETLQALYPPPVALGLFSSAELAELAEMANSGLSPIFVPIKTPPFGAGDV